MKITSLTVPSPLFGIINLHVLIKCAPFVDLHVTANSQSVVESMLMCKQYGIVHCKTSIGLNKYLFLAKLIGESHLLLKNCFIDFYWLTNGKIES